MTQANSVQMMTVRELMSTKLKCAAETDSVRDTLSVMRTGRFRHMPVLDQNGQLLGVVSDRDVLLGFAQGPETPIGATMSRHLQWVHPDTSARDAAARMLHDKIGCLPVLDDKKKLVGIITDTDFVEVAHRALTLLDALKLEVAS